MKKPVAGSGTTNARPEVSFIIPVYNCEDYLPRCLRAVSGQNCANLEIILIDDCSTDSSFAVCEEFARKDERVTLLRTERNSGPAAARNIGMRHATGKFMYFMDSDDDLHHGAIERMSGHFARYDVDLVMANTRRVDFFGNESEDWSGPSRLFPRREDVVKLVAGWMDEFTQYRVFGCAWGKLYKTDIIMANNLQFDEKLKAWEDIHFVMSYLNHTQSIYYDETRLYYYYHNQANHGSATTYKGYMDFRHTVYKTRDIVESGGVEAGALFCKSYSECALRMVFNCCYRMKLSRELYANMRTLVSDGELQSCIAGYELPKDSLTRFVPGLIQKKRVLPLILIYKLEVAKKARAKRAEKAGKAVERVQVSAETV